MHQIQASTGPKLMSYARRCAFTSTKVMSGTSTKIDRVRHTLSGSRRSLFTLRDRVHMAISKLGSRRTVFTLGTKQDDGVPLKVGSRIYEIHQKVRSMLSQGLVFHIGKALTLISCFATDWVFIRSSLIASSMMSCTFHFLFPDPRPMRMFYGFLFACGHAYSLLSYQMQTSNLWEIKDKEKRALYDEFFKEAGFTHYHFNQILDNCDCKELTFDGDSEHTLFEQGGKMECIYIVMKGEVTFYRKLDRETDKVSNPSFTDTEFDLVAAKEHKIGTVVTGGVVGEIYDRDWNPDKEHYWRVSARCGKQAKLLQIEKRKLHRLAESQELIESACNRLIIKDLWRARRATAVLVSKLESEVEQYKEENDALRAALSKTVVARVLD